MDDLEIADIHKILDPNQSGEFDLKDLTDSPSGEVTDWQTLLPSTIKESNS